MRTSGGVAARHRESVLVIDPVARAEGEDIDGRQVLDAPGRRLHVCGRAAEGLAALDDIAPDLVVASLDTTDLPGLRLVEALRARWPALPVIAVTATPTVAGAVAALRAGASDYLGRPASPDALAAAVERALAAARATGAVVEAKVDGAERYGFTHPLSRSPRMIRVFDAIRAVAQTDATVLIRGETGTGKELVARAIHERSRRRSNPLLGVNCGVFPDTLLGAELFGHDEGGAHGRRAGVGGAGVFEMADGGSVFLGELATASPAVQVDLLRVLEERRFRRGATLVPVNARVLAATSIDLEAAVADGRFREDLYYRLDVFPITLPSLRERAEDIPVLLHHFLADAAREYELPAPAVTPEALAQVLRYRWPGNVRQLRAMCERWVIQCRGEPLRVEDLPPELLGAARPATLFAPGGALLFVDETVPLATLTERLTTQLERAYLHKLLARHAGHQQNTADAAGITRRTLYSRMKALGLEAKDYR